MYNNPGKIIKNVSTILCILGIILSIASAIFLPKYFRVDDIEAIVIMFVGIIITLFITLLLYGLGELVDNSTQINKKLDQIISEQSHKNN